MNKDPQVLKALAELGVDVTPTKNSLSIEEIKARLEAYEKEMGQALDPKTLAKYLG